MRFLLPIASLTPLLLGAAPPQERLGDGPLEFRCNSMQVRSKPNRTICHDDVVVRRGNLLVCCELFEGFATDDWGWEKFICTKNVRAQRGDETIWSEKAEFIVESSDLILTGNPLLHRGKSILSGERVVIDVRNDRAQIIKPRGRLEAAKDGITHSKELPLEGKLPSVCPLPDSPTP